MQNTFALDADAIMVAVPGATPVINPFSSTVATFGAEDFHTALEAALPESFSWYVFSVKIVRDSVFS